MLKAVLVGLGNVAWRLGHEATSESSLNHRDAFLKNDKVSLLAGYSPIKKEVDEFICVTGSRGFTNLEKMLKQIKPDIVSICSPKEFHAQQLELCLLNNVPMVWLEKPATNSITELRRLEIVHQSMKKPSTVLVNFQRRYSESYINLKEIIDQLLYGKPLLIEINYSLGLKVNGSHMIDILTFLFPEKKYELLWVQNLKNKLNPDFILSLDDSLLAHFCGIDNNFHNLDIRITFEKARLSIEHGGSSLRVEEVRENELFPGYYVLADVSSNKLGGAGFNFSFDNALNDLIDSHEKSLQPRSSLNSVYLGQSIIEKVFIELSK